MGKRLETGDLDREQTTEIDVNKALGGEGAVVEATSEALQKDYLDQLNFMEEEMVIVVAESADPNSENPVCVGNGGVFKMFQRGIPTKVKRKFVDSLIVRAGRVTTPQYTNNAGERAHSIKQTTAHKYPFSVIEDRNPLGAVWLRQRLAEGI